MGGGQPALEHTLNGDQLDSYEKDGFLVLPDYMPEMVAPLLKEIDNLKVSMAGNEELYSEPGSEEVRTIFKPFAYSQLIDRFSRHPKVLNVAQQLLGSEVYITQSRVNVKPAYKGKSFAWHSDFETWHVEDGMPRMRAVTAWIMLTENNEFNGPLYVIPGSHKDFVSCAGTTGVKNYTQSLKAQTAGVPQPETMDKILENREIAGVHGRPGTVVFHECNIIHGSPDNISGQPRTLLMFVYNSCENKLVDPYCDQPPRPHYLRNPDATAVTAT
jgi:ectoine hydroxylase